MFGGLGHCLRVTSLANFSVPDVLGLGFTRIPMEGHSYIKGSKNPEFPNKPLLDRLSNISQWAS